MDRRVMYKKKSTQISNIEFKRNNIKAERHSRRTNMYNERRNIMENDVNIAEESIDSTKDQDKLKNRKIALQKYIVEREALKKVQKLKQRPPFKVGIPHHGNSPVFKDLTNFNSNNQRNLRVTRSTARAQPGNVFKEKLEPMKPKLLSVTIKSQKKTKISSPVRAFPFKEKKSEFNFQSQKRIITSVKKLTSPHTPTVLKRSARKVPMLFPLRAKQEINVKNKEVIASSDEDEFFANPLPEEEDNIPLQVASENDFIVNHIPVCSESSSINEVVHQGERILEPISSENSGEESFSTSGVSTTTRNSRSTPEPADGPTFQRARLDKETVHLLALADEWETIVHEADLPKEVADEIDSVVGNTKLLTRDKFFQFRGLIEEYEKNETTQPISCNDLNGFWDMMYLQVERLLQSYAALQNLKNNDWIQIQPEIKKKRRVASKAKPTTNVSSSFRNIVLAKKNKDAASFMNENVATDLHESSANPQTIANKRISLRNSLSPYIAMRLSGVYRSVGKKSSDVMDTNKTSKSILKRKVEAKSQTSQKKTVLFHDDAEESTSNQEHSDVITPISTRLLERIPTPYSKTHPSTSAEHSNVFTPRRSTRLFNKERSPAPYCKTCPSTSAVTPRRSTRLAIESPLSVDKPTCS